MTYDWQAGLAFLAILIVLTRVVKYLVFKVPALEETRLHNMELWAEKRAQDKYPPVMRATQKAGMYTNAVFVFLVCPFFVTLQPQPVWKILLDLPNECGPAP